MKRIQYVWFAIEISNTSWRLGKAIPSVLYLQVSNTVRTKFQLLKDSRTSCLAAIFAESLEVENEDAIGAAPTSDAPTTSEWSTIVLPTNVRLISDVLRYVLLPRKLITRVVHYFTGFCILRSLFTGITVRNKKGILQCVRYHIIVLNYIWLIPKN